MLALISIRMCLHFFFLIQTILEARAEIRIFFSWPFGRIKEKFSLWRFLDFYATVARLYDFQGIAQEVSCSNFKLSKMQALVRIASISYVCVICTYMMLKCIAKKIIVLVLAPLAINYLHIAWQSHPLTYPSSQKYCKKILLDEGYSKTFCYSINLNTSVSAKGHLISKGLFNSPKK